MTDNPDGFIVLDGSLAPSGIAVWSDGTYMYPVCGDCGRSVLRAPELTTCRYCGVEFGVPTAETYDLDLRHDDKNYVNTIVSAWVGIQVEVTVA